MVVEFRRILRVVFGINLLRSNSISYKGCLKEKKVKKKETEEEEGSETECWRVYSEGLS